MADVTITNNSCERAVTTNYFDGRKRYAYRITKDLPGIMDGLLQFRIDDGSWTELALPQGVFIDRVAADNNRVFVRTTDRKLYWRCLLEDSANWVVLLLELGKALGTTGLKELLWNQIASNPDMKWIEDQEFADLALWSEAYLKWVPDTHNPKRAAPPASHPYLKGFGWNSLEQRKLPSGFEIDDIAVGHWKDTVVTYYVLAHFTTAAGFKQTALFFLDEEPIMHSWEDVPDQGKDAGFLLLDSSSRISASHSVVAAITGNKRPYNLQWMRIDAHRPGHVDIWPLNWTESWSTKRPLSYVDLLMTPFPDDTAPVTSAGRLQDELLFFPPFDVLNADNYPKWHSVSVEVDTVSGFIIDVGFGRRPWPVPKPGLSPRLPTLELLQIYSALWWINTLVTVYSLLIDLIRGKPGGKDVGFLGENPIKPNPAYPMCFIVESVVESGVRHQGFAISDVSNPGQIKWTDDEHLCQSCAREKDIGFSQCARTADQGYMACCDWIPCKWFCDAFVWISNWVCILWTWVSNWVCVLWE